MKYEECFFVHLSKMTLRDPWGDRYPLDCFDYQSTCGASQFFNREDYKCKVGGKDCQFHIKAMVDGTFSENENLARSS